MEAPMANCPVFFRKFLLFIVLIYFVPIYVAEIIEVGWFRTVKFLNNIVIPGGIFPTQDYFCYLFYKYIPAD